MASINARPTLKLETGMPPPSSTENPRPILKVNTAARQPSFSGDIATPTPSGESRKIKIKLSSQPSTPAATSAAPTPSITKTKAGRTPKPTAKLTESKKRGYDSDEDRPLAASRHESNRPNKMIKIRPSISKSAATYVHAGATTPISSIKFRLKGEHVEHRPGDAYDSEASDREEDPVRESTLILRTMPGESTEYLKKALSEGTIGLPKQNGGADFNVQFVDGKQRRAMVTIDGIHYAAVLVRLPTVTEAMKTWDRKNMMKNSDITEMLLCFEKVRNEAEAKTIPLPPMVLKNEYKWPHGITPPMHDAVNRRFRKTLLSEKQWQSSAAQVAKLVEDDDHSLESRAEFLNEDEGDIEDYESEDAEGEIDQEYFGGQPSAQHDEMDEEVEEDDLLAMMEAELANSGQTDELHLNGATSGTQLEAATPMTVDANTPAALQEEPISEEDEDDSDDDDMEDREEDEEVLAAERERKEKLDAIADLKRSLEDNERQLSGVSMPMLKKRLLTTIENIKKEIHVKKAALGLTDED
ncbi:TAFII55 protein conserved region-domain-containing protein [Xylariaceae sp. FL0662B]|nr:TAFII55 protein conserved region-domain-containing protein [Xylariaceae sp. FL0662B]